MRIELECPVYNSYRVSQVGGMFDVKIEDKNRTISRVARYVQEHCWHESEKITEQPDGSLLVEYELREMVSIKTRLLSYGSHAEVLEPESLRNEIREEIELMRRRYCLN